MQKTDSEPRRANIFRSGFSLFTAFIMFLGYGGFVSHNLLNPFGEATWYTYVQSTHSKTDNIGDL